MDSKTTNPGTEAKKKKKPKVDKSALEAMKGIKEQALKTGKIVLKDG